MVRSVRAVTFSLRGVTEMQTTPCPVVHLLPESIVSSGGEQEKIPQPKAGAL